MDKSVLAYVAAVQQKDRMDFFDYEVMANLRKGVMRYYGNVWEYTGGKNMSKPGFKTRQDQEKSDVKPLELYLEDEGNGAVSLFANNPNDDSEWAIASLDENGMTLYSQIDDDMIPTDKAGHIKVSKE